MGPLASYESSPIRIIRVIELLVLGSATKIGVADKMRGKNINRGMRYALNNFMELR